MIEDFYGFQLAPFRLMPDPRFFFPSDTHSRALAFLEYGLEQGEGHIVLTGDVGVGKSMVIAYLLQRIDRRQMDVVSLRPATSPRSMPFGVSLRCLGLPRLPAIRVACSTRSSCGCTSLPMSDGERSSWSTRPSACPLATLDELRMLANLEVAGQFPLQCFFVGQSEFPPRAEPARAGAATPAGDRCASRRAFGAGRTLGLCRAPTPGGGLARPPRSSTLILFPRLHQASQWRAAAWSTRCLAGCCSSARWSGATDSTRRRWPRSLPT